MCRKPHPCWWRERIGYPGGMVALILIVLSILASPFKAKSRLEAENAALRQQLIVLRHKVKSWPRLANTDRWFFVQLYRWFPSMLDVLIIIRPETLVRWHRKRVMEHHLVDRIYECSLAPECWPGVLDELAGIARARGGWLLAVNGEVRNWTSSPILSPGVQKFVEGGYLARSERASRAIATHHAGFLREIDFYSDEEMSVDPIYRDLPWPAGLGYGAATIIPSPTTDTMILCVEKERARGPVETSSVQLLDTLRPHLARSALLSARLQLERARVASETLALIGLPALTFDERGKVLAANHLIEAITDHICWRAHDSISMKDPGANALFSQAIEALHVTEGGPSRSFAMRGSGANSGASMVAHVVPVRRTARDIFLRCAGVLVLTPVTLPRAPPVELVQSLFDLTAAEARVARGLVTGETLEDIASTGNVSRNTVRTQLRGVLDKTGCRRQAEVVALLGGIATPHI